MQDKSQARRLRKLMKDMITDTLDKSNTSKNKISLQKKKKKKK